MGISLFVFIPYRVMNVIIYTPEHWDMLSRRWKQQRDVQEVSVFTIDELHLIDEDIGVLVVVLFVVVV